MHVRIQTLSISEVVFIERRFINAVNENAEDEDNK